ncbi:molybdenum cofactor guanylyltransferase [Gracilibacillus oryzae]|uniref:Probable molybdenum cofactor guanylyltransferase n=1 Tax=Gracilibacillus oryzae TaxID=1672701 RepID=A0A7C8KYK7_9BACI|nr:molybdenum cofactor guanylyltransferase [Gracilibacillus oryzae]KAB8131800.1 molybdenum cofactor guanylyltransferase [Gracilibacillus oryzae]
MKITGVILAGGESRRFGKPKAFAKYRGKEFYLHSIEAMGHITSKVSIIAKKEHFPFYSNDFHVLEDVKTFRGLGPLAGLYTIMDYEDSEWYMTLPVDTPRVNEAVLKTLLPCQNEAVQAYVPIVNDRIQPLVAIYHHSAKQTIYDLLVNGKRSMRDLLNNIHVKYIPYDKTEERYFQNINTQAEFLNLPLE